ncbi:MAG: PTS sugar transporter subunit IIA [Planctomycetota bacterium]
MELLDNLFEPEHCILELEASDLPDAIRGAMKILVQRDQLSQEQSETITAKLLQREAVTATAIGQAVAVPHAYDDILDHPLVVFARLTDPINAGSLDGVAVEFVFLLIGPTSATARHIDSLATIARFTNDTESRYELRHIKDHSGLKEAYLHFKSRITTTLPKAVKRTEGVDWTGRFAGGMVDDWRRRLPHYRSDFKDGVHAKSLASIMFMFFACLAPTVTFGGVIGVGTGGQIGAVETIIATTIGGILYALLSGQPLNILGTTGPLLAFITTLYVLCLRFDVPFLPTYCWVSIWTGALVLLMSVCDASFLMRYFTRFTDEIFAALIAMIFIFEALSSLAREADGITTMADPSTPLLTLLLALGTLYLAMNLQAFRRSRFLLPWMREFLGDFGPTIALVAMSGIAFWLSNINLTQLQIPSEFSTTADRAWLVNPFDAPQWIWLAAAVPGLLGAVLVFLDQNITARLVNSPDHKLHKGPGYHWDLAVVGTINAVFSLFGLPWLVAATVRSLTHVRSLSDVEEQVTRDGTRYDRILHVRENRITGLMIHVGIGLSLLALPLLKLVPMAVLYGMFLFMGLMTTRGNQFFERLMLFPMDSSLYPQTHYMRRVPTPVVHLFTAIQLASLGTLWLIKSSAIAIVFPVFIAMLVPVRLIVGKLIKQEHLAALDADELPQDIGN